MGKGNIFKALKIAAIGIFGGLGLAVIAGVAYHTYLRHETREKLAIHTPNGIQEAMYVPIGGIDQWIQIRGQDRANPVLLYLHGGPGGSALIATPEWQPWEQYFTVVQWDQRGAGRTYRKSGSSVAPTMTIDRMVADGLEVAQFLRAHLQKDKIVLVGHSWGSILGIRMVKQRPDLFAAYVGTGQVVNMRDNERFNYAHVTAQAKAANNQEALQSLGEVGAPPYSEIRQLATERKWADILAVGKGDTPGPSVKAMPDLSLLDMFYTFRGFSFSQVQLAGASMDGPLMSVDLQLLGTDFAIPVFFFEGTEDQQTPIEPAEQYFEKITAPTKEFVRFEGDHHFVVFNRPDEFLKQLLALVRPLTDPPP